MGIIKMDTMAIVMSRLVLRMINLARFLLSPDDGVSCLKLGLLGGGRWDIFGLFGSTRQEYGIAL
jgi:hypothetical protein